MPVVGRPGLDCPVAIRAGSGTLATSAARESCWHVVLQWRMVLVISMVFFVACDWYGTLATRAARSVGDSETSFANFNSLQILNCIAGVLMRKNLELNIG